jgi:hypothetical protein
MPEKCSYCRKKLILGTRVFQLAKGTYLRGAETPTFAFGPLVLYEGHEDCFAEFPIGPQRAPYECLICRDSIRHKDKVVYAVIGEKPESPYTRPQRRGHKLPFIAHELCWERNPLI